METGAKLSPCRHCGHPLRGRSDKKFCNDYCRNAYNNARKGADAALVRRINAALLKNRRILEGLLRAGDVGKVAREELLLRGFQFRYATHRYVNKRGSTYSFCYEYGWLELPQERILLVRRRSEEAAPDI
ncbi:hypothetical protein [Flaviaesturariibacter amylovorans]|uniref:DUF2116 family Zn-ribbon domain-containing protein n=1 Tax=Flaviaesturariibacter amylovorans TaxID=1084520 RepID=A0ABP8HE64_9BACT